jgi:hypothetical protein
MAPQPLSRVNPNAKYSFETDIFKKHPDLAALVMSVINLASKMECKWSLIMVDLINADPVTGIAMFQSLTSADAQRAAIRGAAKSRLNADDYNLFAAVSKVVAPHRAIRNSFAHGIWGVSPELPRSLLLADASFMANSHVGIAETNLRMNKIGRILYPPSRDLSKIHVYTENALNIAIRDLNESLETVEDLLQATHFMVGDALDAQERIDLLTRLGLQSHKPIEACPPEPIQSAKPLPNSV